MFWTIAIVSGATLSVVVGIVMLRRGRQHYVEPPESVEADKLADKDEDAILVGAMASGLQYSCTREHRLPEHRLIPEGHRADGPAQSCRVVEPV
jgi:hypothetical protein